jgi:hypothetical protein
MNVFTARRTTRFRQLPPLARPAIKIVNWQPAARLMVAGLAFVTIGSQAGVQMRLSIAAAGVAASSAFLLDDHAAVTLASSPTSLPIRRLHRVTVTALAVGLWWVTAITLATSRAGNFPIVGRALELCVLVAIALAASAVASTVGDRTTGGIAGAACSIASYSTTFLPPQQWLPLPSHPDAPGATPRLLATLACAMAVLAYASRDPATRNPIPGRAVFNRSAVRFSNGSR